VSQKFQFSHVRLRSFDSFEVPVYDSTFKLSINFAQTLKQIEYSLVDYAIMASLEKSDFKQRNLART